MKLKDSNGKIRWTLNFYMVIISENLSLTLQQISDKIWLLYEEFVINSKQFWYLLQVIWNVNECLERYEIKYKDVDCTQSECFYW